ncbi:glycosyltransferase [Nostoc sp. CHAB 5844]|nr:glycosyltransferase [Nostoc sp. CHAB 5844]
MIKHFLKKTLQRYRERSVKNFFNRKFEKRVLISYITTPFRRSSVAHTSFYEVQSAARIFDELGYRVDVINYLNRPLSLKHYDVIYGFGEVFQQYFESGLNGKKTIYYGTGMHVCHQNTFTLKRVRDVYERRGVWLAKSARFVEKTWSHQTSLVDGIIALGNQECRLSYEKHFNGKVIEVPAPYFHTLNALDLIESRDQTQARKKFLWFGSSGLIHKGLDLCLEFFSRRIDLELHICGNLQTEQDFVKEYERELYELDNIKTYGFVDITSKKFREIIQNCSFIIFPSCSEGGGVAALTAIANGGLIPIISRETSISTGHEIRIESLDLKGISDAIESTATISDSKINELQIKNSRYVIENNNQSVYYSKLKESIKKILEIE